MTEQQHVWLDEDDVERVVMHHPETGGQNDTHTKEAFDEVFKPLGWKLGPAPASASAAKASGSTAPKEA